ncbi:hypothetical protein A2V82_17360 [candidate division KSB1 bacterium RBG_16_48_16]|nr:MAG: hypothetical protein A2V82_17360 [candidate division KSB1 bacterium RBG_16_48_16]
MKLLADESVDLPIVKSLRGAGHSVLYVAEMNPGISDLEVISLANDENALLLTADKDFGELFFRQHRLLFGAVLIRLSGLSALRKSKIVLSVFEQHSKDFSNAFSVISPGGVRIRKYS